MKYLFLFIISTYSVLGFELVLSGEVYNVDKTKKIMTFERHEEKISKSETNIKGIFKDLNGKILVIETATLKEGVTINAGVEHFQTKESGTITLKDGILSFKKKVDGEIELDTEKHTPNFLVGMTFIPFIHRHWKEILNGDSIESRFGVWYRKDTVGFDLFKTKDLEIEGRKYIEIKMSASSFIIRAIVDPIYFIFEKETKNLKSVTGRVSPKSVVKGKHKDLDAFIEYTEVN